MEHSQLQTLLSGLFPPWPRLSDQEKEELAAQSQLMRYRAGENLHSRDLDCIGMLLIKSGELRVYLLSEEGREITLYRLHQGEACVLSAAPSSLRRRIGALRRRSDSSPMG